MKFLDDHYFINDNNKGAIIIKTISVLKKMKLEISK